MDVYCGELSDVARYIEKNKHETLRAREPEFHQQLRLMKRFKKIEPGTQILEIGTGTGAFPLLCKANGIACKGLEISPQLIEFARQLGREVGVEPDIELGNIETYDIGRSRYDIIVASSVFEHIQYWRPALHRIAGALKPGGLLYFASTNKFALVSGEYPFPLYGWLPDRLRFGLRKLFQGPDIMKLGIDFNQFRYPQLRRAFREAGFTRIYDRIEMKNPREMPSFWKRMIVKMSRHSRLVKNLALTFCDATIFACIK